MTDGACDPSAFITLALTKCHASFQTDLSDRPVYKGAEHDIQEKKDGMRDSVFGREGADKETMCHNYYFLLH